ncbi:MAG: hypothetical protein A2Z88_10735 [Omnitrophica WOR_2 bacterium GWA2_47_8]|nr:MAG: hypothetical protein A2Z88_10735 [Omnitrophica WOR_2 bacterium GWA2_47_8]
MPCSDSSSSIAFKMDQDEKFISFDFAKITCGREITAQTGYSAYLKGRSLEEILGLNFSEVSQALNLKSEEEQFILYLEWDALRSAVIQYLGTCHDDIDGERCHITSIASSPQGIEVALVLLPPKEMPKIIACGIADKL